MISRMSEDNKRPDTESIGRRTFLASAGILAGGLTGFPTASAQRSHVPQTVKRRLDKTQPSDIREQFTELYGAQVAKEAVSLWKRFARDVMAGQMSEDEALAVFFEELQQSSPVVGQDLSRSHRSSGEQLELQTDSQRKVSNGTLGPSSPSVTTVTPQDSQEVILFDGGVGGSGVVGFRDSNYYTNLDKVTSICETIGVGDVSQWAWLEGNVYIENGGTHDIVCDYFENGLVVGGSAQYDVWVQEEGESYKNYNTLKSTSSSVNGNETRSVQYVFSNDTVYNLGVRLKTTISGFAQALSDYQTINADGSTRGLEINSLNVQPV